MKISQKDRVLQYIKEKGSITRLDAASQIGCYELAARICNLEEDGFEFTKTPEKGKNRFGDPTHWIRYRLKDG